MTQRFPSADIAGAGDAAAMNDVFSPSGNASASGMHADNTYAGDAYTDGARDDNAPAGGEADKVSDNTHEIGFSVDLDVYSGPFDVLLSMIAERRLDVSQVALSTITEDFFNYVRGLDASRNMDEASAFIDVASVLVEAKSATLLPSASDGADDGHAAEALRERDLLFARLLQYRAFKQAASDFRARLDANSGWFAHPASCDWRESKPLPELVWKASPLDLALLAVKAFSSAPSRPSMPLRQLHVPLADLREQARVVRERLSGLGEGDSMTFDQLIEDADDQAEVVARFLAVLAFFKQGVLRFRQDGPFAGLHLRWEKTDWTQADDLDVGEMQF